MTDASNRWGKLASDFGVEQTTSTEQAANYAQSYSASDALESAKTGVLSAASLADRVNASFEGSGDFAGGSVSSCVESALGASVAAEFGLSQQASHTVSMGMGSSSSTDDEEE